MAGRSVTQAVEFLVSFVRRNWLLGRVLAWTCPEPIAMWCIRGSSVYWPTRGSQNRLSHLSSLSSPIAKSSWRYLAIEMGRSGCPWGFPRESPCLRCCSYSSQRRCSRSSTSNCGTPKSRSRVLVCEFSDSVIRARLLADFPSITCWRHHVLSTRSAGS